MSENTNEKKLEFTAFHQPGLKSGSYEMTATQKVHRAYHPLDEGEKEGYEMMLQLFGYSEEEIKKDLEFRKQEQLIEDHFKDIVAPSTQFHVAGERFQINPNQVKGVFPPKMGVADYSNVLPHLMITPSTLPWQRIPETGRENAPWLMLLLLHESEQDQVKVSSATLGELVDGSKRSPHFPKIKLEPGQTEKERVQVIDIPKELCKALIPNLNTLSYCTHVRKKEEEMAVMVANRLPEKGALNSVHLISLENRFKARQLNDLGATSTDLIRFVQLYSWTFTSTEHFKVSQTVINRKIVENGEHKNKKEELPQAIQDKLEVLVGRQFYLTSAFEEALLKEAMLTKGELKTYRKILLKACSFGDFANTLKHVDLAPVTLQLPSINSGEALRKYLDKGFIPLKHQLRTGASSYSWYHSPLATGKVTTTYRSASNSDELLQYFPDSGMLDVSYAAAWELGRWLTLAQKSVAVILNQDKLGIGQEENLIQQVEAHATHHLQARPYQEYDRSANRRVQNWLNQLRLLECVPFHYLIPEEKMLPTESIRFFTLDQSWMQALVEGALSIGGNAGRNLYESEIPDGQELITGFILRSHVVAGWPGMFIEGYGTGQEKLTILRREKLSENVLIVLFQGELTRLDFHLKPEVLHFGLNRSDDNSLYTKCLRDETGKEVKTQKIDVSIDHKNCLSIEELVTEIDKRYVLGNFKWGKKPDSALFALQMIEGVEKVEFCPTDPN